MNKQCRALTALLLLLSLTSFNVRHSTTFVLTNDDIEVNFPLDSEQTPHMIAHDNSHHLSPNASFGACLMMKEDNDLLYEWIAYHYLTLPLRYLVVGSDEGNMQDPNDVLGRWNNTGLQHWVMNSTEFVGRHGPYGRVKKDEKEDEKYHHHQFIYRQRGFVTTCAEFLKEKGMHWITYLDSDEFIVINSFNNDDDEDYRATHAENATYKRRSLISDGKMSNATILDIIQMLEREALPIDPCYVMPRLRFGALEQLSCNDTEATSISELAKSEYNYAAMSTLRYKQHAGKNHFAANKFGKVMVDLTQMGDLSLAPPNVHRPFKSQCPYPVAWFKDSLFTINHYTASWERYSHRKDERRNCENWIKLAYYDQGDSCDQRLYRWFPRFIQQMGSRSAKFLLGADATRQVETTEECPSKTT